MRITIVALALASTLALAACHDADAQRVDWTVVQNRLWIERMPKDARDMINQLVLLDDEGQRVGASMKCSRFRYFIDVLAWQGRGDELRVFFPQTREERRGTVKAWNCTGKAPDPFELCLEVQPAEGQKRIYFSKKDWVIESVDQAQALTKTLTTSDDDGDDDGNAPAQADAVSTF